MQGNHMEITEIMIDLAFLMPFFLALQIISTSDFTFEMCQCLVRPSSPPLRSCNLPQSKEWRVLLKQWPRPCMEMDIHISGFVIDSIYRNLPLLGETVQLDSYLLNGLQILSISLSLIVAILIGLIGIHHIISTGVSFTTIMAHVLVSPVAFYYQYHLSSLCRIKKSNCLYPLISSKQKSAHFSSFSE